MTWQKKTELPDYAWADITDLLRDYFVPDDVEWEAYRRIFGPHEDLRLFELNELCANFVMPTVPPELLDYPSGGYKAILWEYAKAALVCRSCTEP